MPTSYNTDIQKALNIINKEKGIILWHDYDTTYTGMTRAMNELYEKGGRFEGLRHIKGTSLIYLTIP